MPDSERSFADRVQKAVDLHSACSGFSPAYVAAPGGVSLASFHAKIGVADGLVHDVDMARSDWQEVVYRRVAIADLVRETTTQLITYIKSSSTWNSNFPTAKRLADAIRGIHTSRKVAPPPPPGTPAPPPGTPAPRQHQRGGRSYAELEHNWQALVSLAVALPGFAPTDVRIQAATINALVATMTAINAEMALDEAAYSEAHHLRRAAFYDEGGLAELFRRVKTNVKGQYGNASTQWNQVKGMRW